MTRQPAPKDIEVKTVANITSISGAEVMPAAEMYGMTDQAEIQTVKEETTAIHRIGKKVALQIVEIGDRLKRVRLLIPYGQWATYLDNEFQMSERTANNYLHAATVAAKITEGGKSEIVSDLPATVLYLLGEPGMPPSVIEAVSYGQCEPTVAAIKDFRATKTFTIRDTREGTSYSTKPKSSAFKDAKKAIEDSLTVEGHFIEAPDIVDSTATEIPAEESAAEIPAEVPDDGVKKLASPSMSQGFANAAVRAWGDDAALLYQDFVKELEEEFPDSGSIMLQIVCEAVHLISA